MKEETKIILDTLKDPTIYAENIDPSLIIDKVEELEKKLLQVEKYLNLGGIIADKNGNPCKHGDKVKYINRYTSHEENMKEEIIAPLVWDSTILGFSITADMHSYSGTIKNDACEWVGIDDIELVEQGEKIDI